MLEVSADPVGLIVNPMELDRMLKGIFVLSTESYHKIYGSAERDVIAELVDIYAPQQDAASLSQDLSVLSEADIIFSGWGMPMMDEAFLEAAPNLRAVFYGAGSIKRIVTQAFWERDILITSAYAANAIPVAEYTLSQILFCLKRGWHYALAIKRERGYVPKGHVPGAYGSTVGIISLGMIGRRVVELLRPFDLKVIAYDPYVTLQEAADLNVELCSLDEIFQRSDVVSLHTPWLRETEGMIKGAHLASMKPHATFINTARGAIVRETEMIDVLTQRSDIQAVLDVTHPEPPESGSPLYTLPNVVLTPHIAGSMGEECRRMGQFMIAELKRYLAGVPLQWAISREKEAILA
jgi:phosphoglycerate dehydrogenase-like enzyme